MRPIDADLLEKQLLELAGDNPPMFHYFSEAIGVIRKQPTISALEKQIDSGWVKCSERLPECEEEVWIQTKRGTRTTAMYEDGKMSVDNSIWNWNDIDFDYNEETDTYFIPKGWWEYKHFAPDDVYNYAVDEEVIVWQPLPKPYQESEERNDWI